MDRWTHMYGQMDEIEARAKKREMEIEREGGKTYLTKQEREKEKVIFWDEREAAGREKEGKKESDALLNPAAVSIYVYTLNYTILIILYVSISLLYAFPNINSLTLALWAAQLSIQCNSER